MDKKRIQPLDGLRALAALGVVWIHTWSFFGNPALSVGGFDFYKLIAITGNGVDFFFVISGFCMFLMAGNKLNHFGNYFEFLKKRLLRIAPAYYTSIFVYAVIQEYGDPSFSFCYNVFFHLIFLNNVITGNTISGPFWSIGTEWHFYMVLPFLMFVAEKLSLIKTVFFFSIFSILLFCFVNLGYLNYGWWETQILIRFPEFGVGIAAGYYFLKNKKLPRLFLGVKGIFIALAVMYLGRVMMYTEFLQKVGSFAFLFKSLADTIMTTGFGLLLYHVITESSMLSIFLSTKPITYLGRISYSIYLWHSLVFLLLSSLLRSLPFQNYNPLLGFIIVGGFTILISHFSYNYLEAFYFKKKPTTTKSNPN